MAVKEQYLIKTPETDDEYSGLYSLQKRVHGHLIKNLTRKFIEKHPDVESKHFLIVKDSENDTIAATIAMIPWKLVYYNLELKTLEMGIVATDERYRKRGLIMKLNQHFHEYFIKNNFHLSIIQGIAGFYQKMDYYYAIPLENHINLELHMIEDYSGEAFNSTRATATDTKLLASLYSSHIKGYTTTSLHQPEQFAFMLNEDFDGETDCEIYLVRQGQTVCGYFKINKHGFSDGLIVGEVSTMSHEAYLHVLSRLKAIAREKGKPFIKLTLPEFHDLSRTAFALGAYKQWSYEWQIKLNLNRFIRQITPVLEQRIAESMFAGLDYRLEINLYRSGCAIEFKGGKIIAVEDYWAQQEECALSMQSFYRLIFGCASLKKLLADDREIVLSAKNRLILETLFPKGSPYLYQPY